jgi:hypothetical protein
VNGTSRIRSLGDRLLARLAQIGADPQDDDDTRAGKALLVLISVLILPVSLLWAALYLAFGSRVGWVPLGYFVVLLASIVVFSRTRNFEQFLYTGQVAILFAPTLSMVPLGGFLDSGGVGLWGILAPLGALVFSEVRAAGRWYVAWVVVFLGSGLAGELLGGVSPAVPVWFTSTMLALNVTVGGTIVFTLLAVFASQRRDALAALREEQSRSESLLLNILPRSIADRLKVQTQTIVELGNRNAPVSMLVYMQKNQPTLLITNNKEGAYKVPAPVLTEKAKLNEQAVNRGGGAAGIEVVDAWKGVKRTAPLDAVSAVVIRDDGGSLSLLTLPLP